MDKFLELGKNFLGEESKALLEVSNLLDQNFSKLVEAICSSNGAVITTGIGKPSYIAMKLSATLASLRYQSFFLNPSEAFHGDLGRIKSNDILIMFSNSGESEEIIRLLPSLKLIGCKIASITGNTNSTLAKASDYVINIGKIPELPPLGLAPTTSAIVMLGISDALAMTVLSNSNFKPDDFAFLHPGGTIGKSLLLVKDIMRTGQDFCLVEDHETCRTVLHQIAVTPGRPGAAALINKTKLAGIFTDGDLRRLLENRVEFLDIQVNQFMSKTPLTINNDALVINAIKIFKEKKVDQLIVINTDNEPVGLLDIQDLLSTGFIGFLRDI